MKIKICDECGAEFVPKTARQRFCKGPHLQICKVCGAKFEYSCSPVDKPNTCSKKCKEEYRKHVIKQKYGVENVSQIPEVRAKKQISNSSAASQAKMKATCLARYGVERAIYSPEVKQKLSESLKSKEVRDKVKTTFKKRYGVDHIFKLPEYRKQHGCDVVAKLDSTKAKVAETLLQRYGVTNIANIPGVKHKAQMKREQTMIQRYGASCLFKTREFKEYIQDNYGVDNVIQNKDVLKRAARNKQRKSSLEIRLHNMLDTYNIEYIDEYVLSEGRLVHSYDVYIPKYKLLIDCDGEYWHSYLSDPDGDRVRDDLDNVRVALTPEDHMFYLIVESDFERGLNGLRRILEKLDNDLFDYDSDIFKWCRSVGFPYYNYSEDRLRNEWARLRSHDFFEYSENRMFGISIINQFHRSIYDAHVFGSVSPKEAWDDDGLLKQTIANRLIYKNTVDPSKVLQGFNISKIAAKVSVFNPTLAGYICNRYLKDFDLICDPFSGFSGRLLGVTATGKKYVGRDINSNVIEEAGRIVQYFNIPNVQLYCEDVLSEPKYVYPALLTCPPYYNKEIYADESVFHSCEDWIDIVLGKYECDRYVFVVDDPGKYAENVVEELKSKSHFRKSSEYIVVIDR